MRKKLKDLAKNNPNIIFLGAQFGKTLRELFINAYIYVHPSEQEGLPLTVMEAAGYGQMLLLSNIKPHKEVLGDLPLFFKNKNINDLKKKLRFVLSHPKQTQVKAKQIQKHSTQVYSWDKGVNEIALRYQASL